MMRRYYELLEVSEDATPEEITKAYKRKASKHHPDKNPGDEENAARKFAEVQAAYECLIDPKRRQTYDENGDTSIETGNPVDDLFIHILNEILPEHATVSDLLERLEGVAEELVHETTNKINATFEREERYHLMIQAVGFKGKGANLVEGVILDMIKETQRERTEMEGARTAARGLQEKLKDYLAKDRPTPQPDRYQDPQQELLMGQITRALFSNRF